MQLTALSSSFWFCACKCHEYGMECCSNICNITYIRSMKYTLYTL